MKSISGRKFVKLLESKGWVLLRVNGSHHIYSKPNSPKRIPVPIHSNKALKTGLLKHFLKVADISEDELLAIALKPLCLSYSAPLRLCVRHLQQL